MNENISKPAVPPCKPLTEPLIEPLTEPIHEPNPEYTKIVEAGEDGYRCGYHHGFHAALEAVGIHLAPTVLEQVWIFLDYELSSWRNRACDGSHPPPTLKLVCTKFPGASQEKHQARHRVAAGYYPPHRPPVAEPALVSVIAPVPPVSSAHRHHRMASDGDLWKMVQR